MDPSSTRRKYTSVMAPFMADVKDELAHEDGGEQLERILELVKHAKSEHEKSRIVSVQKDLDELCTKRKVFQQFSEEIEKLRNEINKTKQQIKESNTHLPRDNRHIKYRNAFQEYCGLEFKVADNHSITLNFTNIDPNAPNKVFYVNLSLSNQWTLLAAEPEDDRIQLLVTELNVTNNIHFFCKKLRTFYQQNFC